MLIAQSFRIFDRRVAFWQHRFERFAVSPLAKTNPGKKRGVAIAAWFGG